MREGHYEPCVLATTESEESSEELPFTIILPGDKEKKKEIAKGDKEAVSITKKLINIDGDESTFDVEIDSLPERPWREPGADPSDYFNYGFTETTYKTYRMFYYFICDWRPKKAENNYVYEDPVLVFQGANVAGESDHLNKILLTWEPIISYGMDNVPRQISYAK